MSDTVLVGDVGGTHVRFGIGRRDGAATSVSGFVRLPADDFPDFAAALSAYLETAETRPKAALFAFAGPILDGAVTLTNRPWRIETGALARRFGLEGVRIVNDFAAMARSAAALPDVAFETIRPGEAMAEAPILVAGPGTGFGMASLLPTAQGWRVLAGEGGHRAFAPQTPLEWAVAERLRVRHGYVSIELAAAGVGFEPVRDAVCAALGRSGIGWTPQETLDAADAGDEAALAICRLRAACVMGACGDMALAIGALGGVAIAGGVAERLSAYLAEPEALARFAARGPMTAYLAEVPVRLIREPVAALVGAAALHFDAA